MSQLSKREEVWLRALGASFDVDAGKRIEFSNDVLKGFDTTFPVALKPENDFNAMKLEYNDAKSRVEPGTGWGLDLNASFEPRLRIDLQKAAKELRRFFVDQEETAVVNFLSEFDMEVLYKMREKINTALQGKETNSQL